MRTSILCLPAFERLQRNPVNTVTNGPDLHGRINGVAVLPGQGQIS